MWESKQGPQEARESEPDTERQEEFTRRVLMAVGVTALAVVGLLLLGYAAYIFLLVFAGVLLAVFLHGLGSRLSTLTGLSRGWSLALVMVGLVMVLGLAGWFLVPRVAVQVDQLTETLPEAARRLETQLGQYRWGRQLLERVPSVENLDQWLAARPNLLSHVTGFFSTTFGLLADLVIILFIGVYAAVEPDLYRRGFVRLVPALGKDRAREVWDEVGVVLWRWLLGRLVGMAVIAGATTAGLWLLGVPLALTLGLVAGLLNFIPNLGPLLSAMPALLIALPQGLTQVLYVALLYSAIQLVESYLLTPFIQRRAVALPPVLILTAQVLLGVLLGGLGLILATPLTAALVVVVQKLYVRDVLRDPDEGPDAGTPTSGRIGYVTCTNENRSVP